MTAATRITGARRRVSPCVRAVIAATMLTVSLGSADAADVPREKPAAALTAAARLLIPTLSLSGAQLSRSIDPTGTPSVRSGITAFQRFIHPASVAGRDPDTYIADIGSGAVYRFDSRFNVMTALPGIRAQTGIQLHVARDLSLYVVDPLRRRVLHYARSGQLLASFSDDLNLARPVDVAVDEARGRVLVADGMYNHLVAFHPLGRASYVIHLRSGAGERVFGIAGIATGAEGIFLSDPLCGCIAHVTLDGAVLGTFGQHDINQPGPIAVDRHQRVFVVDAFDGSLKVFLRGELIHDLRSDELGLQKLNDVWVSDGAVILSDGTGAAVKIMRLAPPAER